MIVSEFLAELKQAGVHVSLDGSELVIKGNKAALTAERISALKENKPAIISFLREMSGGMEAREPITTQSRPEHIPVSLVQQSYWFLDQLEEGQGATYNMPIAFRIKGKLDIDLIQKTFSEILQRHEGLRTNFITHEGVPMQVIREHCELDFELIDISAEHPNSAEMEPYITRQVQRLVSQPFNLASDLLFRVRVVRIDPSDHVLVVCMHHIVSDGWSLNILSKEFLALFDAFSQGAPSPLPPLPIQYADFAIWQAEHIRGAPYERQLDYWRDKLAGLPPLLELPTDRPRPPAQSYRGDLCEFRLSAALVEKLKLIAQQNGTTLFNVLLSGLDLLLARYSGTDDIAVGTAIANRNGSELEGLIGFFVNTVVLRANVNTNASFRDLLKQVTNTTLEAYANPDVPFDGVVEVLQPERSLSIPPVFQVMFRLHNQAVRKASTREGSNIEAIVSETRTAKLDLNFSLIETDDGIEGEIEFATDLFDKSSIMRMAGHYERILNSLENYLDEPAGRIPMLTDQEMLKVHEWNDTNEAYPQNECMHQLFEKVVARVPDKTAYVVGEESFTYRQLNDKANRIAHFLKANGIGPEVRVGLCVGRTPNMAIGALGIFKSDGVYVPLDPNYPSDRLSHMVETTTPTIILTEDALKDRLPPSEATVICLDTEWDRFESMSTDNPEHLGHAEHACYVLFTSGSTGKPKGIVVAHKSWRNMALAQERINVISENNRLLQFASLSFSISLWGSFMGFLGGGTVYQVNDEQSLPGDALIELLRREKINILTWPVSMLATFPPEGFPDLKTVISSAEPCTEAVVERWKGDGRRFMNMYGNSEVSLGSTVYEYYDGALFTIGKPFKNTQMYLLDEELQQVPIGVKAEIYTGGAGLARCYMNRPEATAEKFIPNPFSGIPGDRLYRTGDLGRYLPNGEIEFIGREDFQVSLRGFRIELTEIEDALRESDQVDEVAVVTRPDHNGIDRLVAFIVPVSGIERLDNAELRQLLISTLPNYMVPSIYIQLDAMPLTPNRKVDRLGLPTPDLSAQIARDYVEPETALQKKLAMIWADVLDLEKVGISNNFFEIGGHSLLATQIVSRIKEKFGTDCPVRAVFESPTVEDLARRIELDISRQKLLQEVDENDEEEMEEMEF